MPRKHDLCLFCEENPCSCEGTKKPKKASPKPAKKTPTSEPNETPVVAADMKAAMKAAALSAPPTPAITPTFQTPRSAKPDFSQNWHDPDFDNAINALESALHPDEKRKYAHILDRPDMRAQRWRMRNA